MAGTRVTEDVARPSASRLPRLLIGAALVSALALAVNRCQTAPRRDPTTAASPGGPNDFGGTLGCREMPRFVSDLGFPPRSSFSTGETAMGLVLLDMDDPDHTYQHPTWTKYGWLGPFALDAEGNVYAAPSPRTDLLENAPDARNDILKVDTSSGVMSRFVRLDPAGPDSEENPFGILELTYDCSAHSLYASSVAGSTRHQERGTIVRIDPVAGKVVDRLAGVDAVGLGVFSGPHGRRLFIGLARRPEVWSIALTADGDFTGPARLEFGLPAGHKAGELRFDSADSAVVVGATFDFTLVPAAATGSALYTYSYLAQTDSWVPQGDAPIP